MCWFIADFCVVPIARFIYAVKPTPT
jgi:hypothetical protein